MVSLNNSIYFFAHWHLDFNLNQKFRSNIGGGSKLGHIFILIYEVICCVQVVDTVEEAVDYILKREFTSQFFFSYAR